MLCGLEWEVSGVKERVVRENVEGMVDREIYRDVSTSLPLSPDVQRVNAALLRPIAPSSSSTLTSNTDPFPESRVMLLKWHCNEEEFSRVSVERNTVRSGESESRKPENSTPSNTNCAVEWMNEDVIRSVPEKRNLIRDIVSDAVSVMKGDGVQEMFFEVASSPSLARSAPVREKGEEDDIGEVDVSTE